jgi:hypothetical protein
MAKEPTALEIERNIGDFAYPETHTHDAGVGLTEKRIRIGSANSASTLTKLS